VTAPASIPLLEAELSEERALFRASVRELVRREIAPRAHEIDEASRFPREALAAMAPLGYLGIPVPEDLGGAGGDLLDYLVAMEEIAAACASTALTLAAHTSLATLPIVAFGTERQKQKHVPDLAAGRKLGAFCLTEPQSGSDAAGLRTTARRQGDRWLLSGTKLYITSGSHADTFIVAARTDASVERGARGVSAFIVERAYGGISVSRVEDKLGMRGSDTAEVVFQDCPVPAENVLGKEGEGFGLFMKILDGGRLGIGAMGIGIARASLEWAAGYARERRAFGKPIAELGAIRSKIADTALGIHAARLLVEDAARRRLAGEPHTAQAAMAKLYGSELAVRAAKDAIQILGANGYSREYPVERFYRDAKLLEIGEGTSEVLRIVIAKGVLREGA